MRGGAPRSGGLCLGSSLFFNNFVKTRTGGTSGDHASLQVLPLDMKYTDWI